jgi:hypothetical protein
MAPRYDEIGSEIDHQVALKKALLIQVDTPWKLYIKRNRERLLYRKVSSFVAFLKGPIGIRSRVKD